MSKITIADLEQLFQNIQKMFSQFWLHPDEIEADIFYQFVFFVVLNDQKQSMLRDSMEGFPLSLINEFIADERLVDEYWESKNAEILVNWGEKNYSHLMNLREERFMHYSKTWSIAVSTKTLREGCKPTVDELTIIMAFSRWVIQNVDQLDTITASLDCERGLKLAFQIINAEILYLISITSNHRYTENNVNCVEEENYSNSNYDFDEEDTLDEHDDFDEENDRLLF